MLDADAKGSWDTIVAALGGFVAKRVAPADADDVLQDVLLRIHASVGRLDDDARFGPWAYAIARNAVIDHHRKRRDVHTEVDALAADADADAPHALQRCVTPFIARLPSPYREAITLVDLEGLTQQAAADAVAVSLPGMKSRVQRGRRLLRAMFQACCALTVDARGRVTDARPRAPCACEPRKSKRALI